MFAKPTLVALALSAVFGTGAAAPKAVDTTPFSACANGCASTAGEANACSQL